MIFLTSPGKTYSVNSVSGCTISAGGTTLATIPANVQTTFIAPEEEVLVSDNNAIIVEVTGVGAGGSGGSGEGGSGAGFELTAEAIREVVPIAWDGAGKANVYVNTYGLAVGVNATASTNATAFGNSADAFSRAIALGHNAKTTNGTYYEVAIGNGAVAKNHCSLILGSAFAELVDDKFVEHFATTEGTGSITIGAGANTLVGENQYGCDNSVTIGCKANSTTRDSVTIGASAVTQGSIGCITIGAQSISKSYATVAIGQKAESLDTCTIAIGDSSTAKGYCSITIGNSAESRGGNSLAIGQASIAAAEHSNAIGREAIAAAKHSTCVGYRATVSDLGATVIRSTAEDGTITQLYFSGANTPLANTYESGEAMMGYVVSQKTTDENGTTVYVPVAAGTQKLSALFPNNSTFQPATLDENGEWVQPKVFHPSDLDLPVEEPTEPEPYTPLPVYPIVETEIEEIPSES